MKPLTIDFLIRSLGQGGAERQLVLLASGLARRGHRVRILTFYPGGPFENEALVRGLEIHCLHKRGRWDVLPFVLRLHRAIRDESPDLVHGYMGGANLVLALLKPLNGRPLVLGVRASNVDLTQYDLLSRVSAWMEARLARAADLIIANSGAGRSHALSQGFPEGAMRVVENGVECDQWRRDLRAGDAFRASHGIPGNVPLLGLVGRLDPMKGHEVFLRAAARLLALRPNAHFAAVGSGPDAVRRRLAALAHELGIDKALHWIPGQVHMVPVYSAIDALVSASVSGEGFPNVVAEAMACGLRPVVTGVGDSARVVGACGWVVPAGDADALALAMGEALEPASLDRPNPRAHIEASFGIERLVDRTEALLRGVLQ